MVRYFFFLYIPILVFSVSCTMEWAVKDLSNGLKAEGGTVVVGQSLTINAHNGEPPYQFDLMSGQGYLAGNVYKAPLVPGLAKVLVRDAQNNQIEAEINIVEHTVHPKLFSTHFTTDYDSLTTKGNIVFAATEDNVDIVDATDPSAPSLLTQFFPGHPIDNLFTSEDGSYLFVDTNFSIDLYDIGVVDDPQLLSSIEFGSYISGLVALNGYLYIATNHGLHIYDISNPKSTFLVDSYLGNSNDSFEVLKTDGTYLYSCGEQKLKVYDIALPDQPNLIHSPSMGGSPNACRDFVISGNRGYNIASGYGVEVWDITTPGSAYSRGSYDPPSYYYVTATVAGNYLYVDRNSGASSYGFDIINIADPDNPILVGSAPKSGNGPAVLLPNGSLVTLAGKHLAFVDISSTPSTSYSATYPPITIDAEPKTILSYNDYAILQSYSTTYVVNVENPEKPAIIDQVSASSSYKTMILANSTLFVLDNLDLVAYDLSDPANLQELDRLTFSGTTYQIHVYGDHLYYLTSAQIDVVDISDPNQMTKLSPIPSGSLSHFRFAPPYLYAFDGTNDKLEVRSLADPTTLPVQSTHSLEYGSETCTYSYDMRIYNSTLFVVCPNTLVSFSLPSMSFQDSYSFPYEFETMKIHNDELIVALNRDFFADHGEGGFVVFDATSPLFTVKRRYEQVLLDRVHDFYVKDHLVHAAAGFFSVVNINRAPSSGFISGFPTYDDTFEMLVDEESGELFIVAEGPALSYANIQNIENPELDDNDFTGSDSYYWALDKIGDYVYAAHLGNGVKVWNLANPLNPSFVTTVSVNDRAKDILIYGTLGLVADEDRGLLLLDLTDPASPAALGNYDTSGRCEQVAYDGSNYAYLACSNGLVVIDISDPLAPTQVALLGGPLTDLQTLAKKGDYIYVGSWYGYLAVVDVTNPLSPQISKFFGTGGGINRRLTLFENELYTFDFYGITQYDISDPSSPRASGHFNKIRDGESLAVTADHLYVSTKREAVYIYDKSKVFPEDEP